MEKKPVVAVIMGSAADLPVMEKARQTLEELGIPHDIIVASAHRTPDYLRKKMSEYEKDGVKVYIAGAGMSAHLAGVVASMTLKPVIGVPVMSKMMGLDSLLSTVQMPSGMPVATVAIDGAKNAAILAAQIIALENTSVGEKLSAMRKAEADKIINTKLEK